MMSIFFLCTNNDVGCFKDMAPYIINAKLYKDRYENLHEESNHLVSAAAKHIVNDIRRTECSKDTYPVNDDICDVEKVELWLTELLQHFLQELIPDKAKRVSIGQCIVLSAWPQSTIAPVPLHSVLSWT